MASTTFLDQVTIVTAAWANDVDEHVYEITRGVKSFGAKGDGTTDDTTAIQEAADLGLPIEFPPGKYITTKEIVFKNGTKFIGSGWWGAAAGSPDSTRDSIIFYNGDGGTNSCVIRASSEAVGTEPTVAATRDLRAVGMKDMSIDGNGKAEFGLYTVRVAMSEFNRITIENCKEHGWWGATLFTGVFREIVALNNEKNGITLGEDTFSWTNPNVDGCVFLHCRAKLNGSGKTYNDSTNPDEGVGWVVKPRRGNVFLDCWSETNDGAGWFIAPQGGPNTWIGGYSELNAVDAVADGRSVRKWSIWFDGIANALNNSFEGMFIGTEFIRLTGTEPSSGREEGGVKFKNIRIGAGLEADWDNYILEDCSDEIITNIIGTDPQNIGKRYNIGFFMQALTGSATLDFASTLTQAGTDLTITVTGAAVGDPVSLGPPAALLSASLYTAWVSSANTVSVRFNNYSAGTLDPASGTFNVVVWKV